MQQCVYETKICDICDLQKCLTQTWVDSEQNVIEAAIDQCATVCDHVCVLVAGLWTLYCKIIVHLYYVVQQNILWNCQCNLVHLTAISYC